MEINGKKVCPAPFAYLTVTQEGFKTCCKQLENYPYPTVEAWLASPELAEFREAMIAERYDAFCTQCIADGELSLFREYERQTEGFKGVFRAVNVAISNKCQLACRICVPQNSNTVTKHRTKSGLPVWEPMARPYEPLELARSLGKLEVVDITLAGGEPTFDPVNKEFLRELPRSVMISFFTNGQKWDQEFFDVVAEFRKATLLLSIDGPHAVNEYLRTYSSTERALTTLNKWLYSYQHSYPAAVLMMAISNVSVWTVYEFVELTIQRYAAHLDMLVLAHSVVVTPVHFQPSNLPAHLRLQLKEKLQGDIRKACGLAVPSDFRGQVLKILHACLDLVSAQPEPPFYPERWTEFIKYNQAHSSTLPNKQLPLPWMQELML